MAALMWPSRNALLVAARRFAAVGAQKRHKYIVLLPEVPEDTAESNPLLRFTNTPPDYANLTGTQCYNAVGKLLVEFEGGVSALEEQVQDGAYVKTFESVMEPLERLAAPLESAWSALRILYLVNRTEEIAQAYKNELKRDEQRYSPEECRIVHRHGLEARLMGVDLPAPQQKLLAQTVRRIEQEAEKFRQNLHSATTKFRHRVDGDLVKHFPPELVRRLASDNHRTAPGLPRWRRRRTGGFLQHCGDRVQRWNLWQAYHSRATANPLNNSLPIEEIRAQRRLQAEALGYPHFAALSMETKMAASTERVDAFLDSLSEQVRPRAEQEAGRSGGVLSGAGPSGTSSSCGDVPYWRRKQRQAMLARFDEASVREYFPLPDVLQNLWQVLHELLGITVRESPSLATHAWHSDVRAFDILHPSGELAGSFFLDPYSRPGKHTGSWMEPARGKCRSALLGSVPVASMMLSVPPPPVPGLSYTELGALVGRLAQVLEHCLNRSTHALLSGTRGLEWDRVEVCSVLFQWLLLGPTLAPRLASKPLPADLHQALHAADRHMAAWDLCWELYYSKLDLDLHTRRDFWRELSGSLWQQFVPMATHPQHEGRLCSLESFLTSPASRFCPLWARMIAADILEAFQSAGSSSTELSSVGKRFRETFLELGGTCSGSEVFRRFLGRDPSPESLLNAYGLQNKPPTSDHE
ncbi:hypothetical protein HPB48_021655 [Haemaphysalis longicornis]|uniref:Peptidase M3A/M3B catalytic domain-containing protein n=1 Tax=Haemaphysalis longicornis TaxID=44386 RepID=A0A9J6FQ44_HAELO|nr:hypothetical protein HPB48_021655 [Haemaphysalis longicornis]